LSLFLKDLTGGVLFVNVGVLLCSLNQYLECFHLEKKLLLT
jgi:hypothetical protein